MGVPNHRREKFWRKQVEDFRASGMRPGEYCKKVGIRPSSLRYWRLRLGDKPGRPKGKTTNLVSVAVIERPPPQRIEASLRLMIERAGTVEIRGDLAAMAELAHMLKGGAK